MFEPKNHALGTEQLSMVSLPCRASAPGAAMPGLSDRKSMVAASSFALRASSFALRATQDKTADKSRQTMAPNPE